MANPALQTMLARDAALFAAGDFSSVVITAGGATVAGTLMSRDELVDVGGGVAQQRRRILRVTPAVAAGIADLSIITVDGTPLKVDYREPVPPDGLLIDLIVKGGGE